MRPCAAGGRPTEADAADLRPLLDEQNTFHVELLPDFFRLHPTGKARIRLVPSDPNADYLVAEDVDVLV